MAQQKNDPILQSIQSQLNQLVDCLPEKEHPSKQLYSEIVEGLEQLSQNVRRQELILETVAAISEATGSVSNGENVFDAIVEAISDHLSLFYVGLYLLDETGERAELRSSVRRKKLNEFKENSRVDVSDDTAIGWTLHHKKPNFIQEGDSEDSHGAEMILPTISRGQIVGALVLLDRLETSPALRHEDIPLMQGLADQVANSILNANLFATADRRLQQIITLHNVNLQIGSQFDLETILSNVAQVGTKLMGADVGIISLADENRATLVANVTYYVPGLRRAEVAELEEFDERLSNYVFHTGEAILANNWAKHPLANELEYPSNLKHRSLAILCVPMVHQNKIAGTITVQNIDRKQTFNDNDLYLLSLLAAQATAAIENSRLFYQAENNRRFLKTVIEHIPDPIFIKDRNHTLIDMNRANAEIIGQPKQKLLGKTDRNFFPPELATKFEQRDNEVFRTNQPYVAEDKTVWADGQEHIAFTRLIPIPEATGRPQYLLGITHDITESKIREAERERLLAETAALYRGNRAIASVLSERQVFDALFEQIRQHDPCEISAFHFDLVEGEPLWAELVANWQKGNNASYRIGTRFFLPEIPQAKLLTTAAPIFIDDIATDARLSDSERGSFGPTGACSVALLPIQTAGQALGVVLVYFTQPYSFGEDVRRLWLALADQAGVSLLNRQLIQEAAYRAVQIDTAAEVARAASSILDLQELLNSTVALICDRFELYYVGAFLTDETNEWAVLRAGTGEAGRVQLEKGHRLKIGGDSMIGWAIKNRQARIALDVGREAVHFQNPDLPDTRSEMAIPLINRNRIIGALTIQSTEQAAFSRENVIVLQTMADQLAIAIENARLFTRAHENEATTKAILDAIPDLMLRLSRDGTYLDVKESGYVASIMSINPSTGKSISDILPEKVAKQYLKLIEKALDSGQAQVFEHDFSAGNDLYQFETRIVTSGDDEVLAIIRDVTERKRAEEGLAAERNLLRTLIDNIPDYIYVKDTQSRFLLNNTAHLHILGAETQDKVIGKSDFDIFPKEVAEKYYKDEQDIIRSGKPMLRQRETTFSSGGESQWLSTTKVPLRDSQQNIIGLVGISRNITDRQRAEERLQKAFTRTQLLHNISEALTSLTDRRAAFETILGEFLLLLNVSQGRIVLYDPVSGHNRIEAQYIDNRVVQTTVATQNTNDDVDRYIVENPFPLIIEEVQSHPLTKRNQDRWNKATAILIAPLTIRGDVTGIISGEATQKGHAIIQSDIEASKMVADQLSIWLENHQLLEETRYRSTLLQTAAEVSRTASSILDVDELIGASVNLICDQFGFYYVGLFMVDQAREWAVLKGGTGEAGRIQLEKGHRLKIGGESMIGWSIHNRQARIALDVGADRVHFQNPDLPETRSEMALPLVSREEVIGALTVQSQEPQAFSEEDITVLQTMTDQLANAIANARLFENVTHSQKTGEMLLQETQALQQFSQTLAGTLNLKEILNLFFLTCTNELGFDYVMLSLVDKQKHRIKAIDGVGISENNIKRANRSLEGDDIMADIIRTGRTEVIRGWDDRFDKDLYEVEGHVDWIRLFTPIVLRSENIGLVEAGFNKDIPADIKDPQIRHMRAFIDQVALAIENAQHYDASQRAARREALIKEITTKVRASTDLDQILQTTVKEIGDAIGGKRTYVQLISPANGEADQDQ